MKLRKLVLSGFKSFADRTEFVFDQGVSCIVGPNGCGKSNVVDAFKWVLGEQSAKSLRGTEMMDVIFNGCATRKAAGHAEVTMEFDNSDGTLQTQAAGDAPTGEVVSVTRRLFRSGTSEYLINKVPVRLRDVREMFMDTGVGVDAYSLIEQGRVEVFLQSSQEDRRAVFDEAAGISKYKARKKEALRKLERVEQNLLRVQDVLAEVEKRLRSIKVQAGKARNYQEYVERLKDLRSLHFLAQYHTHTSHRRELRGKVDDAGDALSAIQTYIDQLEAARSAAEVEAVEQERAAREAQAAIAAAGAEIATREQRAEMLTARVQELGEQIVQAARQAEALEAKIDEAQTHVAARQEELRAVEAQRTDLANRVEAAHAECQAGQQAIVQLADQLEDEKAGTVDLLRRTAQLHNEIHSHSVRRESLHGQRQRVDERSRQVEQALVEAVAQHAEVAARLTDIRAVLADTQSRLDETKQARHDLGETERQVHQQLQDARERRSAATSRMQTLQEMQDRMEGVAEGVRRILRARDSGQAPGVRGMLADLVRTDREHARLVEAALAGADQIVLVESFADLAAGDSPVRKALADGTVECLALDSLRPWREDFDASTCPGIQGRVIDWLSFDASLAPAMWRLLGRTFAAGSLADAALAAEHAPAGSRFVTPDGDVLEADGRVRLSAGSRAAGVISRRSELDALAAEVATLDGQIAELSQRCKDMQQQMHHLDEVQQKLRTAIYEANTERVEAEGKLGRLDQQLATLRHEQPVLADDLARLAEEIESAVAAEHQAREKAQQLEELNAQRQAEVQRLTAEVQSARERQEQLASALTERKVALAATEQKRLAVRDALAGLQRQQEQMAQDLSTARAGVELARQRRTDAEAGIAATREEIETLYQKHTQLQQDADEIEQTRSGLAEKIDQARALLAEKRKEHSAASDALHALQTQLGETDVRIDNLMARATEEMSMDLHARYEGYQHDDQRDWNAVEAEIQDLRGRIERLGNVNLDAIAEQQELQQRQEFLAAQLDDVQKSRDQLHELIRRINRESKEKFVETFARVRENFQELFRKLFGGGRADVFLLDPEDVLESGIEIVARPPGKETRSISLLSGGEKTMTALALLFSIFRCRPSPVCLLDEVDAALDEANNRRFNQLISEFIGTSQFLMITHAKRSMSMATVLYGVTMQEPGVSTRVSVKFEGASPAVEPEPQAAAG